MTPERLARLRFLANFATYHVPGGDHASSANMMDADAGDDMLELCDALKSEATRAAMSARRASELIEACQRLLKFNEELCIDVGVSTHYPSADFARKLISDFSGGPT